MQKLNLVLFSATVQGTKCFPFKAQIQDIYLQMTVHQFIHITSFLPSNLFSPLPRPLRQLDHLSLAKDDV